jgi:SAM-dependent methyltransferase
MYSDEELSALYPIDYYAYQDGFSHSRWKEIAKRLLWFRIGTRDPQFESPGRILDLGCGAGWFLREMRDKGWDAYGVEINSTAAGLGRSKAGLNIFAGTLQQARFPSEFFEYVRANHSFEHISCPSETLEEVWRIMRPGGRLLIGVPNVGGLNARFFKEYWWYLGAPVHPYTYSAKTLPQLLRKHHFEIMKVTYNSDYTGILGSCQIWANKTNGRKSTEGALINNPVLRVLSHWTAKCVDLFKAGDAIEVIATKGDKQI